MAVNGTEKERARAGKLLVMLSCVVIACPRNRRSDYRSKGISGKILDLVINHTCSRGSESRRVNGIYTFNERTFVCTRVEDS